MTGKRFKHSEIIQNDGQTICYGIEDTQTKYVYNVVGDGVYDVSEKELIRLLNELNECNNFFIEKTVELIKEYLDVADEQEGILFGNAPVERAYALIELLKELGLNDLLKEKGIELLEDDDNV